MDPKSEDLAFSWADGERGVSQLKTWRVLAATVPGDTSLNLSVLPHSLSMPVPLIDHEHLCDLRLSKFSPENIRQVVMAVHMEESA